MQMQKAISRASFARSTKLARLTSPSTCNHFWQRHHGRAGTEFGMRETAVEYDGTNGTDSNAPSPAISLHASESPPKFVAPIVQCARLRPTLLPWHRRCACACAASRAVCPAACISTPLIVALTRRKKQVYMSSYAMSIIIAALTASIVYVSMSYPCLCIASTVLRSACRDMQPQREAWLSVWQAKTSFHYSKTSTSCTVLSISEHGS